MFVSNKTWGHISQEWKNTPVSECVGLLKLGGWVDLGVDRLIMEGWEKGEKAN